jgi:uncharacterized protein YggT (Ycf19 family)
MLWLFTISYTISLFMQKQWFPFAEWIGAVYEPIYKLMFGELS